MRCWGSERIWRKKFIDIKKKSREKWLKKGYSITKEFFVAFKDCSPQTQIIELEIKLGTVVSSPIELDKCCKEFYTKLYVGGANKEGFGEAREALLRVWKEKILEQMKRKLAQPITIDELHLALEVMAKIKTPRLDGVVTEFFLNRWFVIGKEYIKMVQTSILRSTFHWESQKG